MDDRQSTTRVMPSAPEAERALVGACLRNEDGLRIAASIVRPGDFHDLKLGHVFAALCDLDAAGEKPDGLGAANLLRTRGLLDRVGGEPAMAMLAVDTPAVSNTRSTATVVAEKAVLRRMLTSLEDLSALCMANTPAAEVVDSARLAFDSLDLPSDDRLPDGAMSLDEWADRERSTSPWVVPGLLRQGHRVIIVAPEGVGKSWVSSQIAIAAAQGVHPFGFTPMTPVNSLIIDAENPEDVIDHRAKWMLGQARIVRGAQYREDGCWIWSQPGGLDVRSRRDKGRIEALLRHVKPSLVVLGPLYKVFRKRQGEDHEEAAVETQQVLDDLRTRYGFALVIEAHAPHGASLVMRDLRVRNSVAWQGWPEFGLGLRPNEETGSLTIERFRGDRAVASWPERLDRTKEWPWSGYWPNNKWMDAA